MYGVLRRNGLSRLAHADRLTGLPVRYVRERPGELIRVDVKRLGRVPPGGGHRILGEDARKHVGVGYDFLRVAVDDATRVAYVAVRPDELAQSTVTFIEEAVGFLAEQGVRVERVMTDNAWTYTHSIRLAALFKELGIRHVRTRPRRPQTNGKDVHLCQAASSARSGMNSVPALSIAQRTRSFVRARAMIAWWWDLPSARLRS